MRLRIDLAYDGSDFHGWAAQPGLRTVETVLASSLGQVLRIEPVQLTCAGRTDTGVHARGQVVHVDVDRDGPDLLAEGRTEPGVSVLLRRLNGVLPEDVRVLRVAEAAPGFDARFSASWRRYAYRVADAPELVDPLTRRLVLPWPRRLDVDLMNRATVHLVGEHDFAAFCKKRAGATTIRSVRDLAWARDATGLAVLGVRADAFCHHMVRSVVGLLMSVGEGRRAPGWAAEVLHAGVRDPAVSVAPARGLTLEEVGYPADADLADHARSTRRVRVLRG